MGLIQVRYPLLYPDGSEERSDTLNPRNASPPSERLLSGAYPMDTEKKRLHWEQDATTPAMTHGADSDYR